MRQIDADDPFRYEVALHETITITVTPIEVGPLVVAALDGSMLDATAPDTTPTFRFTANKLPGRTHFVMLDFSFPGAPASANYRVRLEGSLDAAGTNFGFRVNRDDPVNDPIVRFTMA